MDGDTLVAILRRRAVEQADARAYTFLADGEEQEAPLTYGELDRRARAVAARLQELGLAGERAILVYPSGLDYLAGFFGCLYAGVVAIPAYPPRPNRSAARLQAIVRDARAAAALTTADLLAALAAHLPEAPDLAALRWLATDALDLDGADAWRDPLAGLATLALVQYTSGSTATPRGVMITHGNLLHNQAMIQRAFPQPADALCLGWLPPYHDMGLIGQVLQPLYAGYPCVFLSPSAFLQRPSRWLRALSRYGATVSGGPNFAYELCIEKATPELCEELDLHRWQGAYNGAEPIRPETIDRFATAFAGCGFRRQAFYPCYGLAEATLIVSGMKGATPEPVLRSFRATGLEEGLADAGEAVAAGAGEKVRTLVSSGGLLDGQRVAIVDPDGARELPACRVGEIWVMSGSVAQGYWGRAEETASTFGARLEDGAGPFLRTGDLGFVADGELFVTGRRKDVIIVRGRNHYPQDLEWTAERSHPHLLRGAGAAFSVDAGGEERLVIVQEVDRRRLRRLDAGAVTGAIRRAVAEEHEVEVHAVLLVRPLSLPKTSSGKIQRHLCREAFVAGSLPTVGEWRAVADRSAEAAAAQRPAVVSASPAAAPTAAMAAATPREAAVRRWLACRLADRLGVAAEAIDVRAPFVHHGLDSAQTLALAGELEVWLSRRLDSTLLYEYPTIEALARHLGALPTEPAVPPRESGERRAEPIAIVGMACRFPGADGLAAFWRLLRDGVDAVGEVPADRGDLAARCAESGIRWGGFLRAVERFDPQFFGMSQREAARVDPQQRLLLETAWEALEDAGIPADRLAGSRTGVFVGISTNDYGRLQADDPATIDAYAGTGNSLAVAANRLSFILDLRGPSMSVDTACSSSLVAVHLACRSLESGECDLALAGGVNLILTPEVGLTFARAGALAGDGRCKAFDARADGFVRSEGAGCVALKPLARALADGDPIHAVIRGTAVNQDGRTNGLMAPSPQAQEAVLREACRRAGAPPGDLLYVEAHGTGTLLGDPIEAKALGRVLSEGRPPARRCAIGSVKTNLGHLEAAAGIAGLIKTALALREREIPASLHFVEPNPHIPFAELPLVVQRQRGPWPAGPGPALAGVSSFGFGGTNAHVVLAAPPRTEGSEEAASPPPPPPYLVPLSARDRGALAARARSLLELVDAGGGGHLADLAYTTGARRAHLDHRLALVVRDAQELRDGLAGFLRGEEHPGLAVGQAAGERRGPVFVLCGQGPQSWGMGRELAMAEPVFRAMLEACDRSLAGFAGWSLLAELTAPEARSRLAETAVAQPALVALQIALAALWRHWGVEPGALLGHSAGELAAAHLAGVLGRDEVLRLAVERGSFLERAAGGGRMAQVDLAPEEAEREIAGCSDLLSLAAVNAPRSVVLSGNAAALAALLDRLRRRQVFCRELPMAYGFHSSMLEPWLDRFEAVAASVAPRPSAAVLPLMSTLTGRPAAGGDWDAAYWRRQARAPVRFGAAAGALIDGGHRRFLELGPHPVLSAALRDGLRQSGGAGLVLPSLRRGEPEREVMLRSLAALHVSGQSVEWRALHPRGGRCVALPAYPWQREPCWLAEPHDRRAPGTAAGAGGHPLLGRPLQLAHPRRHWLWEGLLDASRQRFLEDHRVEGAIVVPATAFLEMAVAAAAEIGGGAAAALRDVRFHSPLVLPGAGARRVQLLVAPAGERQASFRISSRPGGESGAWALHATGTLLHAERPGGGGEAAQIPVEIGAIRARCAETVSGADYYPRLHARGLQYGPLFQGIETLWQGRGEALGQVTVPPALVPELSAYHLHPAVLDACGQVIAATEERNGHGGHGGTDRPFLPVGVDELRIHGRPSTRLWSHARRRTDPSADAHQGLVGDALLLDEEGRLLVEARGLRLRYLDGEARSPVRSTPPADLLYELRWEVMEPPAPRPARTEAGWLIFADRSGVADALASRLGAAGQCCVLAFAGGAEESLGGDRYGVRPGDAEDLRWLLDLFLADGRPACRGVVHLWSLDAALPGETDVAALEAAELHGCATVLALVQELARRAASAPPRLWLITRGAQAPEPQPAALAVAQAPLWGFGRTLAQEHPGLWGGLIDLDPQDDPVNAAAALDDQLRTPPGGETQLAWRRGTLYAARLGRRRDLLRDTGASPRWRTDGAYLITGGLGGLGLEVARWMAGEGVRRLVLLGRTQLPPRAGWTRADPASRAGRQIAAVRELEATGVAIHLAPVDVADEAQLAAFLEGWSCEGWPPIRGVIHAAGVLDDRTVLQLDAAALAAVFRAKVLGGWLLHRLMGEASLDHFVLFSSAAGLLGSAGQAHYAAANAFLDALAHHRRAAGKPAASFDWGPWAAVGMAARGDGEESLARRGLTGLGTEEGLEMLGRLLDGGPAQIGIVSIDWQRLFAAYPAYREAPFLRELAREAEAAAAAGAGTAASAGRGNAGAEIRAAAPAERLPRLVALLVEQVARVVGVPGVRLDLERPLGSLGIDSLMAAELKNRIEGELGVTVPIVRLLEGPSLTGLAAMLLDVVESGGVAGGPGEPSAARPLLVALRREGARPPFFCIHPGALDVGCYDGLVRCLGEDQPFYVLQPWELDNYRGLGEEDAESQGQAPSLLVAADRCAAALRTVQARGPFRLGGWSMGGLVAWRVAQRLRDQGEEVARLVLFDSPAPPLAGEAPADYDDGELLPMFARYLGARHGRQLPLGAGDLAAADFASRLGLLLRLARDAGVVPPDCGASQLAELLRLYKHGLLRSVRQLWTLRGEPIPYPVTFFRAGEVLAAYADLFPDPAAQWGKLAAATVEIHDMPGDHYAFFLPSHLPELAQRLARSLAEPARPRVP